MPPNATGIDELGEFTELTLYPVPTSDVLFVNLASQVEEDIQINVMDLRGRVIHTIQYDSGQGLQVIEMNTSNYEAGSYILEAISDNARSIRRFEVVR